MGVEVGSLSIFEIIKNSFVKCFKNIVPFLKFFAYPVLGQIIGIAIAILPTIIMSSLILAGAYNNGIASLLISIISLVIGLVLFCHAFWKSLIRTIATYVISKKLILENSLMNFKEAEEDANKRTKSFIYFLLWMALICIIIYTIALILFYLIFNGNIISQNDLLHSREYYFQQFALNAFYSLLWIPFFLSYAAFSFNPEIKAFDAIKKGVALVSKHFFNTVLFYIALFIVTALLFCVAIIITVIFKKLFILLGVIAFLILFPLFAIIYIPIQAMFAAYWYLKLEAETAAKE